MLFRKTAFVASAFLALATLQLPAIAANAAAPQFAQGGQACTVVGTAGNDTLNGTAGSDVICGLGGNDVINGLAGNDVIDAGIGSDVANGGAGDDTMYGGAGNDNLNGAAGNDLILGGAGNDIDNGSSGTDTASFADATNGVTADLVTDTEIGFGTDSLLGDENLVGSPNGDTLNGDNLTNALDGGAGNDTVSGNAGNDLVSGGAGDDTLSGGAGADSLQGGSGNDALSGGAANDILTGGAGNDSLVGGDGTDTANYSDNSGGVNVDLGAGTETGQGSDTLQGDENVTGGSGDDSLTGNVSNNALSGGAGNDFISGGAGNDSESGGVGNDTLTGDAGKDNVNGNDGTNVCDLDAQDVSANCLEDTIAPEIVDFKIAEAGTTVDVTSPNHTLHTRIRIKENFGKIKVAEFYFRNGAGANAAGLRFAYACGFNGCGGSTTQAGVTTVNAPGNLIAGNKFDGTYSFDLDISGLTAHGTYTFYTGYLIDSVGNTHEFTAADNALLNSQSFSTSGLPVDPNADASAPVVKSLSFESQPETGAGQPVKIRFEVADEGSGVDKGGFTFLNQGFFNDRNTFPVTFSSAADCASLPAQQFGWGVNSFSVPWACLVSGDASDGVYEVNVTLPRYLQFGDYVAYQLGAQDKAGNQLFYNQYNSPNDPYGAFKLVWHRDAFAYTDQEDYWAPTVDSYSWVNPTVNTGKADAAQFIDIHFTDASGVGLVWVNIAPVGKNVQPISVLTYSGKLEHGSMAPCTPENTGMSVSSGSAFKGGCLLSGDEFSGVVRMGFTIPRGSASGAWDLVSSTMVDTVGNQKNLYGSNGVGTTFTNTPTN